MPGNIFKEDKLPENRKSETLTVFIFDNFPTGHLRAGQVRMTLTYRYTSVRWQ